MNNNLYINPNASTKDVEDINNIVSKVKRSMETLNDIITNQMGEEGSGKPISMEWAKVEQENWTKYYTADIPQTMDEMSLSATNLQNAVNEFLAYSQKR